MWDAYRMLDIANPKFRLIAFLATLLSIQVAISCLWLRESLWIEAYVNGHRSKIAVHATIGELIEERGIKVDRGDLVDVEGRVLKRGEGLEAQILLNGRPASTQTQIKDGDSVFITPGKNLEEGLSQDYAVFQTPSKTSGWRSSPTVGQEGKRFMRVITRGALSGKVIAENEVEPPLIYGRKNLHIDPNAVALCFDDGPDPRYTTKIIEILKAKEVPATFFVIGMYAERFPQIVKNASAAGFEIGNHTFSHKPITKMQPDRLEQEVGRTDELISRLIGKKPHWFRPPQLLFNEQSAKIVESQGYSIVLGSIDPSDYLKPPAAEIVGTALRQAKTGSIVVMHDGGGDRSRTVEALPMLIDSLRAAGYKFVKIEDLFTE